MAAGPLDAPLQQVVSTVIGVLTSGAADAKTASIVRYGLPTDGYNPRDGSRATVEPQTYPVTSSPPVAYNVSDVDGDNIQQDDFYVTVAALGLTIEPDHTKDKFVWNDVLFKIISVGKVYASKQVCAYKLQCRK